MAPCCQLRPQRGAYRDGPAGAEGFFAEALPEERYVLPAVSRRDGVSIDAGLAFGGDAAVVALETGS